MLDWVGRGASLRAAVRVSLLVLLGATLVQALDTDSVEDCYKFFESQTLSIGAASPKNLLELHVRSNTKGEIEIVDGDYGSTNIEIVLEKHGTTQASIDNIVVNQTLFDIGHGTIFVLQLDYIHKAKRTITIVVGSTIASAILLTVIALLVWWFYRRRQQQFVSLDQDILHGDVLDTGTDIIIADEDGGIIALETTEGSIPTDGSVPVNRQNGGACPVPPPPPRRADPTYVAHTQTSLSGTLPPPGRVGGGGGGAGSLSKRTIVTVSVLAIVTMVYAGCPSAPMVRIVVKVPPLLKLDAVKLFFTRKNHNHIYTDHWYGQNSTNLKIFDLREARPTHSAPCFSAELCQKAHSQNLAGCDAAASGKCICQRGYRLDGDVCVDIDECQSGGHVCPPTARCLNAIGSYVCQCGYGFYGNRNKCKPCSMGCPAGQFELNPCTTFTDRKCTDCTLCKDSMYEVRPCTATNDRECIHVAHPLLIAGEKTTAVFLEELKVEASSNVYLEDLHNTKNLDTIQHVTDKSQAYDFYWHRESGLQVNIGVLDVKLIPEYEDIDSDSDNEYILNNPNNSEDKTKFASITQHYCRNPIPDYYSITLEISRDRTTMAENVVCDSKNSKTMKCPPGYSDGDVFLHRTLNDACHKMGTFPDPLNTAWNSVVCTKNTALLRDIFNQNYTVERPIRFPSRRCRIALSRCDQCLSQTRCHTLNMFEQRCCQIDCYTLPDCKLAHSTQCIQVPVECAMGDAYRYTIQPVFQNVKQQYQCQIRLRPQKVLYRLFYFLKLPGTSFQTPPITMSVFASETNLSFQSHGTFKADYITVEHNTGFDIHNEFIIVGQEARGGGIANYTVNTLKKDSDFKQKPVVVHEISHNILIVSTQFRRPFDYSTVSWVRDNDCDKDVNRFAHVQKHYRPDSAQLVEVDLQKMPGSFRYFLKSVESPPYLHFTVPGNTSILQYYFAGNGPTLVTNESLHTELKLSPNGRIWTINVRGHMTGCPAFLRITINNRLDLEELFRHDLLILCPATFNVTFRIPNWGQQPDKTFDVFFKDSMQTYNVYLTHMLFEQHHIAVETEPVPLGRLPETSGVVFGVALVVTGSFLLVCLFLYVSVQTSKPKVKKPRSRQLTQGMYASCEQVDANGTYTTTSLKQIHHRRNVLIAIYILMRLAYSLIFTFTVFFALLMLFLQPDCTRLSNVGNFQQELYNKSISVAADMNRYSRSEMLSQTNLMNNMQHACSHYIDELIQSLARQIETRMLLQRSPGTFHNQSTLSHLMQTRVKLLMQEYTLKVESFTQTYKSHVDDNVMPAFMRYKKYLQRVLKNDWLSFPQRLFNLTMSTGMKRQRLHAGLPLSGTAIDFGAFLEIEEVDVIQVMPVRFWQRYNNSRPLLPVLPIPNWANELCQSSPNAINTPANMPSHHLDSVQFRATSNAPGMSKVTSTVYLKDHPETGSQNMSTFSVELFMQNEFINILRVIFLVLDAILVIYRFSHMYSSATSLYYGFDDCLSLDGSISQNGGRSSLRSHKQNNESNKNSGQNHVGQTRTKDHTEYDPIPGENVAEKPQLRSSLRTHSSADDTHSNTHSSRAKPDSASSSKHRTLRLFRRSVSVLIRSSAIPKLLLACVIVLLVYNVLALVSDYVNTDLLLHNGALDEVLNRLDRHSEQTDQYLDLQTEHLNLVSLRHYRTAMRTDLLNVEGLLAFFNAEQRRLAGNYIKEASALGVMSDKVKITPLTLATPVLPCNFAPIRSQHYSDVTAISQQQLTADIWPYVSSFRNIVIKTGYAVIIVLAAIVVIHIGGSLLFHFQRTRQRLSVRRVCVTFAPGTIRDTEESTYESDDGGFRTFSKHSRSTPRSSDKSDDTLETEVFTETKV